jgi:hypothetical protein
MMHFDISLAHIFMFVVEVYLCGDYVKLCSGGEYTKMIYSLDMYFFYDPGFYIICMLVMGVDRNTTLF